LAVRESKYVRPLFCAVLGLGSARTEAYFSTAPFLGAAVALLVMG
jgi:hypothetical protein